MDIVFLNYVKVFNRFIGCKRPIDGFVRFESCIFLGKYAITTIFGHNIFDGFGRHQSFIIVTEEYIFKIGF
jgi:hypothetical protein